MPSTQILKGRIRSVKSTRQITKAMQLIAAAKMRKAQEVTKASAPYVEEAQNLLNKMAHHISVKNHELFTQRPVKTRLLIFIAADKGLAGAYNANAMRVYTQELQKDEKTDVHNATITIGKRAGQFAARLKKVEVLGSYDNLPDYPEGSELYAILNNVRTLFTNKEVDAVDLIYTQFTSSVKQEAKVIRILPVGPENTTPEGSDVTYEPSSEDVLDAIAYRLVGAEIFQALLDSRASEHVMRMVAMKNATDNANDLIDDLTLEVNKERQGRITQELAEISGGVEALNG
jgi:F-type H+-transporting ATPase subunit gamma